VRGNMVAQRLVNKGVIAEGVRYKVESYRNTGPDSLSEPCCGWGHIKSKCSHINQCAATAPDHTDRGSTGGTWSGAHRNREQNAATYKKNAQTARRIILHSAETV